MIQKLFSDNIIGMLGITTTVVTGMLAYKIMVNLFIQAVVDSLITSPH